MIIDTSQQLAWFDPSLAGDGKVQPMPTPDSAFSVSTTGLHMQRGNGERMIAYFKVDPKFASHRCDYHDLTIQYLDQGNGEWFVEYLPLQSAAEGVFPWQTSERVTLNNSNEKREVCLRITAARLTGHADGADFRVCVSVPHSSDAQFTMCSLRINVGPLSTAAQVDQAYRFASSTTPIKFVPEPKPAVSIVIPVFNRLDYTLDCLRAISEFTQATYEVIVVNNASQDGTQAALESIANLVLINNETNRGFGIACNQGARAARGEFVVFLNNDTVPQPGWLSALIECAERQSKPGCIGSRLIYPHTFEIQSAGVSFGKYGLPEDEFQNYPHDHPSVNSDRVVRAVCGASLLVARSVFNGLGGFDERFLNGLEDVDLCLQLHASGYHNILCASSNVLHYKSATEGRYELDKDRENIALFHTKWHSYLSGEVTQSEDSLVAIGQLPRSFAASFADFKRQTGLHEGTSIVCLRNTHAPGHCVYGPYLRMADNFSARVTFKLNLTGLSSNSESSDSVVSLDVYNSVTDSVLASQVLRAGDVSEGDLEPYLNFAAHKQQILEFRVYWHGNCDMQFYSIQISIDH